MKQKLLSSNGKNRWAITDRIFFSLFLTGMIVTFSNIGAAFFDGVIISRYLGSIAMAAHGISSPIFSVLSVASGLMATGMQEKCAHAVGRGNREEFSRFVTATVLVGTIVSLIVTALVLVFAQPFAILLGASGDASDLLEPVAEYLSAIAIGALPMILSSILAPALQLDTGRRVVQTGAIISTVTNVIMDIVAVRSGWGIFGIGLATAAANYINLLYQCTFFLKKDRMFRFVRPNISVKEFAEMLSNGSMSLIKRLTSTLRPIFLNKIIISCGGVAAMSVFSVQNNFSSITVVFGAAVASAVSFLTGIYYSEINEEGISEVNRYEHRIILFLIVAVSVLFTVFARQIAGLYVTADSDTFPMTVFSIRVCAIQIPVSALLECRIKYLQAVHLKRNLLLLIVAQNLVLVLLSAFVLGRLFGSYGVLACYASGNLLSLLSIYIYYAVKCRKIWPTKKDYLSLPEHYYLHRGNVISLDIRTAEDVTLGWRQIKLFCKGHHTDPKTAYYAALVFEELASNIVQYGFPQCGSAEPMIDLRVVISGDDLVLRLRDNCPKYDVTKQIAAVNEPGSDPLHNIGTRVVSKSASDITYLNTFETNSLIIRFKLQNTSDVPNQAQERLPKKEIKA